MNAKGALKQLQRRVFASYASGRPVDPKEFEAMVQLQQKLGMVEEIDLGNEDLAQQQSQKKKRPKKAKP